jgi:uncharacterized protein YacL (UPF0231 family)
MTESNFYWPEYSANNPTHELIIAYLTIDIQKSAQWINELHQKIKDIQSGRITSWERTGNAYCLHLYPDHVEIEEDYAEEPGELMKISLGDFEKAVVAWKKHINN